MRSADGWDPLFTAGALPVEVFGVYSGERELVLEGLAPAPVRLSQRLAGVSSCCADRSSRADGSSGGCESSVLLWESAVVLAEVWASGTSSLPSRHAAHVIELGAGLGLTSICCAAHGASDVLATEIEPALCALRGSIEMNRACWALDTGAHNTGALDTGALGVGARDTDHNAQLRAARLDWTETPPALEGSGAFDIVVMCDLLYSLSLHAPLLRTLAWLEERRGFKWLVISQAAP